MTFKKDDTSHDDAIELSILRQQDIVTQIVTLAEEYAHVLEKQISLRIREMEQDDKSHYLIYQVLRVSEQEGHLIDAYQNKGRFLYKYAGSFLEKAAILCFLHGCNSVLPKQRVRNTLGTKPKEFEIDCLVETDAIELKWRDATTDGDHITKEHTRVKVIQQAGFKPVRVMFYRPNREQAIRIQETLQTLYKGVSGEYYSGDEAWQYIAQKTGVDLKAILVSIAEQQKSAAEKASFLQGERAIEAEKRIEKLVEDNQV